MSGFKAESRAGFVFPFDRNLSRGKREACFKASVQAPIAYAMILT